MANFFALHGILLKEAKSNPAHKQGYKTIESVDDHETLKSHRAGVVIKG